MYEKIKPIETHISADRQGAKRHYGVHPYFTRRPYNVVRNYVLHYSQEGDCVLDPFGGSGVTAIEAFLENRHAIHNDLNPLANFIAQGIIHLSDANPNDCRVALAELEQHCHRLLDEIVGLDKHQLENIQSLYRLPPNACLPGNSDANNYYELFTPRQLTSMAVLKHSIEELKNPQVREAMLLAWSAALTKINKTFLSAKGRAASRGGSSIFSIYRYKLAKDPIELPVWDTFSERGSNIVAACEEMRQHIEMKRRTRGWQGRFACKSLDVEELSEELNGSVDYIFTDPPYGGHISYLDLSVLWNNWLNLPVSAASRTKELIVGGELRFSEAEYIRRLHSSVRACVRMLKPNRWFSCVFQHWNMEYFHAILSGCAGEGAELRAAVPQIGDVIWSMHKKKNKETVLAGEIILTFFKSGHPSVAPSKSRFDPHETLRDLFDNANTSTLYLEEVLNRLILKAWSHSALHTLNMSKDDFLGAVKSYGWKYDDEQHYWIRQHSCNRPLNLFEQS